MDEVKTPVEQESLPEQATALTTSNSQLGFWGDKETMKMATWSAKMLASSTVVPEQTYRGNIGNCLIALELASRTKFPILHVMQNLYIIKGKPCWSGQFCVAAVNASGKFTPLSYVRLTNEDTGELIGYYAKATRISDGEICEGPPVTWDMVKAEDWYNKSGSKWKTMPDLMFHYRAAAFFVRTFCPEVLSGLQTIEEVQDVKGYEEQKEKQVITFD